MLGRNLSLEVAWKVSGELYSAVEERPRRVVFAAKSSGFKYSSQI